MYVHVCMYVSMHERVVCMCVCVYVYVCMYVYVCLYVCICMCMCVCVCVCVHVCRRGDDALVLHDTGEMCFPIDE